jgi:hypothetical protein
MYKQKSHTHALNRCDGFVKDSKQFEEDSVLNCLEVNSGSHISPKVSLVEPCIRNESDKDRRPESERAPVHRSNRRIWRHREHPGDQEAEEENYGKGIDDCPPSLAQKERRWLVKVAIRTNVDTMM